MILSKIQTYLSNFVTLIIICAIPIFGFSIWFISEPARAALLDRYILYCVDDLFRYNYIKIALYNPWVLLNPYLKAGYAIVNTLFLYLLPLGISSLRILNSFFSIGVLFFIYKITKKIGFSEFGSAFAILLTLTFPIYFLMSLSTFSEIMFCFFLLLAIYLLYCQKYFLSSLVIAFLPTIRQEGVFFILLWIILLPAKFRIKYGLPPLLPILLWSTLNTVLLKHPFFYTFFCNVPDYAPSINVATFSQFFSIVRTLIIHPIFFTCFLGILLTYKNKKYRYILICFITYGTILLIANVLHFMDAKAFSRELRFLTPLIPFMGIYGAYSIELLLGLANRKVMARYVLLAAFAILPLITAYQIEKLQKDPTVVSDFVTEREEILIKQTASSLNSYIKEKRIMSIYIAGLTTTDRIMRRLCMYLPGNVTYYVTIASGESYKIEGHQPLDWATYLVVPLRRGAGGIFISKNKYEETEDALSDVSYVLLEKEPLLSLYIYLIQMRNS